MGFTVENEVEAWEDGQASLGGLWASYFCALHSYQGEDGTKETQTYGGDHQTPTHLDIGFMTEVEKSNLEECNLNLWSPKSASHSERVKGSSFKQKSCN